MLESQESLQLSSLTCVLTLLHVSPEGCPPCRYTAIRCRDRNILIIKHGGPHGLPCQRGFSTTRGAEEKVSRPSVQQACAVKKKAAPCQKKPLKTVSQKVGRSVSDVSAGQNQRAFPGFEIEDPPRSWRCHLESGPRF